MSRAVIDPYLKIQAALADDSMDEVKANAGSIATAATVARRAGGENRHGRRAARVGDRDRATRATSSAR